MPMENKPDSGLKDKQIGDRSIIIKGDIGEALKAMV